MFAPGRLALTDWRTSVSTGASLVKREKPLPDVHPRTVAQGNAGDFFVKYQAVSLPGSLASASGDFVTVSDRDRAGLGTGANGDAPRSRRLPECSRDPPRRVAP